MVYNANFEPQLDYGDSVNVANQVQMNTSRIKIYSYNDPTIMSESVDGDIRTYSIVGWGATDWNYVDLGAIYDLYRVNFYIGPGASFSAGNFFYLATSSGSDAPWNETAWSWTQGAHETTATYVPTSSGYSWGPVNYLECSGDGSPTQFSARWIKFKADSGANRIYDIEATTAMSGELLSGVYFSATSGGGILNHSVYQNTFIQTIPSVQQGTTGATATLWIVNSGLFGSNSGIISSGIFSVVNSANLYDDAGERPGYDGYYAINYSTDNATWYTPGSGALTVGPIASGASVPIYMRFNTTSSMDIGTIMSYIRFTYTV